MTRWMPWVLVGALGAGLVLALTRPGAEAPIAKTHDEPAPTPAMTEEPSMPELPANHPALNGSGGGGAGSMPGATVDQVLEGVVKEHMDVSQYTYVRLATDGGEEWAAVYRAKVKDGAPIRIEHASKMAGFHSRELNRDFPEIWFGTVPGAETAPPASAVASAGPAASVAPVPTMARPKGAIAIGDLAKQAEALKGKSVTVAGRVVKETDGVLGRNWIHLQDGTGDAKAGTNDLLVTSDATSKVGADVIVTGTVNVKQDFGAGYKYDFLVENAKVQAPSSM